MTDLSPCNVIRYEGCCRNQKGPRCSTVQSPAGCTPLLPGVISKKPYAGYGLSAGVEFSGQLLAWEDSARDRYAKISESLTFKKNPGWLDQMLDHQIFPTLHHIGFDAPIAKVIFKIASSSWQLMGPLSEKIVGFHPLIQQQVEEVRQGLELKICKTGSMFAGSIGALPQHNSGTIKDVAFPEHLFDLLDEIATPWIILPRAFRFLEPYQCRYLPVYLKTIERETLESCLKLFSRIAVEFVGNFSLKFADRHHPPDRVVKLLFYGYSALFWKTLRCPPENLANSAAFDSFLNWLAILVRKSDFLGNEERLSVKHMIQMKAKAFPARIRGSSKIRCTPDMSRFMVTLRHGCPGVASILRYFGIDQFIESRQIGVRFACPSIQHEVQGLLHFIRTNFRSESRRTREYIKLFIDRLRSAYSLRRSDFSVTRKKFLDRIFNDLQIMINNEPD